jgi:hypothetical protein
MVLSELPLKNLIPIRLNTCSKEGKNLMSSGLISKSTPPCPSSVAEEYSKRHIVLPSSACCALIFLYVPSVFSCVNKVNAVFGVADYELVLLTGMPEHVCTLYVKFDIVFDISGFVCSVAV